MPSEFNGCKKLSLKVTFLVCFFTHFHPSKENKVSVVACEQLGEFYETKLILTIEVSFTTNNS